ncbi:hypothetical protein TBS_34730 [Thermobispora bispora]
MAIPDVDQHGALLLLHPVGLEDVDAFALSRRVPADQPVPQPHVRYPPWFPYAIRMYGGVCQGPRTVP